MSELLRDTRAEAACRGKQRFASPRLAHDVVDQMNRRPGAGQDRKVYRCPHCSGWHLAHANRKRRRVERDRG